MTQFQPTPGSEPFPGSQAYAETRIFKRCIVHQDVWALKAHSCRVYRDARHIVYEEIDHSTQDAQQPMLARFHTSPKGQALDTVQQHAYLAWYVCQPGVTERRGHSAWQRVVRHEFTADPGRIPLLDQI